MIAIAPPSHSSDGCWCEDPVTRQAVLDWCEQVNAHVAPRSDEIAQRILDAMTFGYVAMRTGDRPPNEIPAYGAMGQGAD